MRPFFPYYGGKWRAAPHYPAPKYAMIVEPFAGAAGYATRYADRRVVLIERDPRIAALWQWLIEVPAADVRTIPLIGNEQTVDDLHVCEEARTLVGFWINKGVAQPRRSPSKWMRSGIRPRSFWGAEIRERVASQVEAIRHWRCVEGSYSDAPEEPRGATWFVDPPYIEKGGHYRFGAAAVDFAHLGQWCRSLPGQVIVCEQEGAEWLPFRPLGSFKANHASKRSAEVVWENAA